MRNIQSFIFECASCGSGFDAPSLSDFSYGEFILWSRSGEFRYLNAFDDVVYQEVIDLLNQQKNDKGIVCDVQDIFGVAACDADSSGHTFSVLNMPCSVCNSIDVKIVGINSEVFFTIPCVTHNLWNSLSCPEKIERVLDAAASCSK